MHELFPTGTFYLPFYQTVCDHVVKTSIIKWDGTRVDLTRDSDPDRFAKSIAHFGLLGVTVGERPYAAQARLWYLLDMKRFLNN